jgi:hypothetical protein
MGRAFGKTLGLRDLAAELGIETWQKKNKHSDWRVIFED